MLVYNISLSKGSCLRIKFWPVDFQFGYTFYYLSTEIQIMEPFKPSRVNGVIIDVNQDQIPDAFERSNDPVDFLSSFQITFVFGKMWARD